MKLVPLIRTHVLLLFCVAILSACSTTGEIPPTPVLRKIAKDIHVDPGHYQLDPEESHIRVKVYRSGTLARLGHNHTIRFDQPKGYLHLNEDNRYQTEVNLDIQQVVVDDAKDRRWAGRHFPDNIKDDAKQGTRDNLLSEAVLNAQQFPTILGSAEGFWGGLTPVNTFINVDLQGRQHSLPISLEIDQKQRLKLTGEWRVLHRELGLKPFSAFNGAIRVEEAMDISVELYFSLDEGQ